MIDYNSPCAIKEFLDKNCLAMQKKFGQNFLINPLIRKKIIDMLDLNASTNIWEIGPGLGAMTELILQKSQHLTAFEIDKAFCDFNRECFCTYIKNGYYKLIQGDVLRAWKEEAKHNMPEVFFGNLPYNISSTLILNTIENNVIFDTMLVMLQKEVAARFIAKANSKLYSFSSVLCQCVYEIKDKIEVKSGNFWPRPKVDSVAILLKKRSEPLCKDIVGFSIFARTIFALKRKTLKNNLASFLSSSEQADLILKKVNITSNLRAEALDIKDLIAIYYILQKGINER